MIRKLTLAALVLVFALPAAAQNDNTRQFVNKAALSDMFEIESSKLALQKSNTDEIKKFAQMMVDDHTKTSDDLKSMAQKMQGTQVPTALDPEHQQKLSQLQSASGRQFDQDYRTMQVQGHQDAVKLFEDYAKDGDNNELKSWANNTLPKLRSHLQAAEGLPGSQVPSVGAAEQGSGGQQQTAQRQRLAPLASPGQDQMLASDLRGTRVYGANNENVGDINDVLIDHNGRVSALIVGVGGFLGIGEKNVAVPFDALEFGGNRRGTTGAGTQGQGQGTQQPDRIVLRGMSRSDLDAAPNFNSKGSRTGTDNRSR
jgi:putative membrane protein